MGLRLSADLDTDLGNSKKIYMRIENINVNRTFGKVGVAVTYWVDREHSDTFKHSLDRFPKGQISNTVVYYDSESSLGKELELPIFFEFDLTKPVQVKIPVYETVEVPEEVPYVSFDELGRKITKYRTIVRKVKEQVGERNDTSQVLDIDLESRLVSWCYGQVKAQLATILPADILLDD